MFVIISRVIRMVSLRRGHLDRDLKEVGEVRHANSMGDGQKGGSSRSGGQRILVSTTLCGASWAMVRIWVFTSREVGAMGEF